MYVYVGKLYILYAFYIFDLVKIIFFNIINTQFMIVLYMYVYIDKTYILYIFYIFDLTKFVFKK